jgi:hypothetical protein
MGSNNWVCVGSLLLHAEVVTLRVIGAALRTCQRRCPFELNAAWLCSEACDHVTEQTGSGQLKHTRQLVKHPDLQAPCATATYVLAAAGPSNRSNINLIVVSGPPAEHSVQ